MSSPYHQEHTAHQEESHLAGQHHQDEEFPTPSPLGEEGDPAGGNSTGDERVDAAMAQLEAMAGRPAAERVAEYEAVHRALQDTLATVDDA